MQPTHPDGERDEMSLLSSQNVASGRILVVEDD